MGREVVRDRRTHHFAFAEDIEVQARAFLLHITGIPAVVLYNKIINKCITNNEQLSRIFEASFGGKM